MKSLRALLVIIVTALVTWHLRGLHDGGRVDKLLEVERVAARQSARADWNVETRESVQTFNKTMDGLRDSLVKLQVQVQATVKTTQEKMGDPRLADPKDEGPSNVLLPPP